MPTMRILMIIALVAAVGSAGLLSMQACAEAPPTLAQRFPQIAQRVPHFEARMRCEDASVRRRVLKELTYFNPRDSELYPPFLRYLLTDESPVVRWAAINRLREHGIFVSADDVPESFEVPRVGLCVPGDPESLAGLRAVAASDRHGPDAGWAITALATAKDAAALELCGPLTDSQNVFVRFSAAMAYIELGRSETGLALLRGITETDDEQSGYYKQRAAEQLVRSGETQYLAALIESTNERFDVGYSDSGINILADLTGQYFATPDEWSAWWAQQDFSSPDGSE